MGAKISASKNPFYELRQENETKLRKTEKTWKKKITAMKVRLQ